MHRWAVRLQDFEFEARYYPEHLNSFADYLSRDGLNVNLLIQYLARDGLSLGKLFDHSYKQINKPRDIVKSYNQFLMVQTIKKVMVNVIEKLPEPNDNSMDVSMSPSLSHHFEVSSDSDSDFDDKEDDPDYVPPVSVDTDTQNRKKSSRILNKEGDKNYNYPIPLQQTPHKGLILPSKNEDKIYRNQIKKTQQFNLKSIKDNKNKNQL